MHWWPCFVLSMCVYCNGLTASTESGAEFLQSVILHLQRERSATSPGSGLNSVPTERNEGGTTATSANKVSYIQDEYKITAPTPLPYQESPARRNNTYLNALLNMKTLPPVPQISKEELLSLYHLALSKSASLVNTAATNPSMADSLQKLHALLATSTKPNSGAIPGYYYYYYPIKSFIQAQGTMQLNKTHGALLKNEIHTMNHIVPTSMTEMGHDEKHVEPLFMAIASFIGMALMFALSVLFLPKFGNLHSRGVEGVKSVPDELFRLTQLVLQAIDGKDCTERIVCEVGSAMRKIKLDNRPIRILEMMVPRYIGHQLQGIRRSAARRDKCNNIPCK